ncbi:MAG: MBL fold metallo-hydrolase [Candidatus Sericytochromatia bacterium]
MFCGASSEIGASCILLELDGKRILLDSGIRLSGEPLPEFNLIKENGDLDCIIVSHAHTDHTGSLPIISKEFSNCSIFMTHPTKEITRVLLHDSLKLMKYRETEIPIFAEDDVLKMLERIKCHNFNKTFKPFENSDINVTFYSAGHIAGAACVFIKGSEGSIFYTGDFSITAQRTVGRADILKLSPDILITESTYGDKLHSSRKIEEEKLIDLVKNVYERNGKILIPAFAVGRAQEVILILKGAINKKQLPPIPIYIDGMVKEICNIYKNHPNYLKEELAKKIWKEKEVFYSEEVIPVLNQEQRNDIINKNEPCCVISSSGMLTGGFSAFYAEHFATDEKNYIAITGYQDEESPGRALLDITDKVKEERIWKINDKNIILNCDFGKYSLSAHADKNEILGVIEKLQPRKIFLIHGAVPVLEKLSEEISNQKTERYREVFIPKNGEKYEINFKNPRKELKTYSLLSMNKNSFPSEENIPEIYDFIVEKIHPLRIYHYTVDDLIFIWKGDYNYTEEELANFQNIINKTKYFVHKERKMFLFRTADKKELELSENIAFNGNMILELLNDFFPKNAGLFKKGVRNDQEIIILNFNFPKVVKEKLIHKIKELENITGWSTEINDIPNLLEIENLVRGLLDEDIQFLNKISYYNDKNLVKATLSKKPDYEEEIEYNFFEETGIKLILDYPNRIVIKEDLINSKPKNRMDQFSASALIERAFSDIEHKIYKKSVKINSNGEKYLEVNFISYVVGVRYLNTIKELEHETGWEIVISKNSNQIELIHIINNILKKYNISIKKNPSILENIKKAKVKLNDAIEEIILVKLSDEIFYKTGFTLELEK